MASTGYLTFSILCAICLNSVIGLDYIKAQFPLSTTTKFPRLQVSGTLPVLNEFTFCSWIRRYNTTGKYPFIFSYATNYSDNEIAIGFMTEGDVVVVRIFIGTPVLEIDCSPLDLKMESWNHFCVTWFGPNGRSQVFVNSNKCTPQTSFSVSSGGLVRSGGVAIIGQDQDAVNSMFEADQAWYGDVSCVHLWDEVLTLKQIEEAGKCEGKRKKGNVIAWLETPMKAIGGAVFTETQLCQT